MHGTIQAAPRPSALAETMVIDPVCGMTIDPATAAATEMYEGKPIYFCSEGCHRRFLANPAAYAGVAAEPVGDGGHACCAEPAGRDMRRLSPRSLGMPAGAGLLASALILGFYFGALTLVSGWPFTVEQFFDWWPYIVALAIGFGSQVGLFVYLRRALHGAASGKVVAATGTTSGAAMVACCSHYLVNLLPVLGATGLVTFVGTYQVELFWFGIASNLAGIAYIGRRVVSFARANAHGA
jgi:YHS domain-containing protein